MAVSVSGDKFAAIGNASLNWARPGSRCTAIAAHESAQKVNPIFPVSDFTYTKNRRGGERDFSYTNCSRLFYEENVKIYTLEK